MEVTTENRFVLTPASFEDSTLREMILQYNSNPHIYGNYYFLIQTNAIVPLGCVCLARRSWYLTEIRHVFVPEEYRRGGLGTKMLELAERRIETPLICATVNINNTASLKAFKKAFGDRIRTTRFTNPDTGNNLVMLLMRKEE